MWAAAAVLVWGCGGDTLTPCVPGEASACECDAGMAGSRECDDSGEFGACVCGAQSGNGGPTGPLPERFASIGQWCGASDTLETWLIVTPKQSSCEDHAASVGDEGAQDGVALRLDTLPASGEEERFETIGRRCRRGTCEDYPAQLTLTDVSEGRGGNGSYRIALSDGSTDDGRFSARWCTWETWVPSPPPGLLARGMRIDDIAFYQGVKVSLVTQGEANIRPNAPVVAGRSGVLRIYVGTDADWEPRDFRVRVTLHHADDSTTEHELSASEVLPPSEDAPETTFNFDLDAAEVREGTQYVVELLETEPCIESVGSDDVARWPRNGRDTLGAREFGGLNVTLVPIIYAPGGNTEPDLGQAMLSDIEAEIDAQFPITGVRLTVREPVVFDTTIEPSCVDLLACAWNDLLGALVNLRVDDGAPPDEFYYGVVMPGADLDSYCNDNCILGVGAVTGASDELLRVATGIGFSALDDDRASTLTTIVHELGHTMGRDHSPCGDPANIDPDYPYPAGDIGSWGHDRRSDSYLSPDAYSDVMGYCTSPWISDYTYAGIAERLQESSPGELPLSASEPNIQAFIRGAGTARWTRPMPAGALGGMTAGLPAMVVDAGGRAIGHTPVRGLPLPDTGSTLWLMQQPLPGWDRLLLPDGQEIDLRSRPPLAQLRPAPPR